MGLSCDPTLEGENDAGETTQTPRYRIRDLSTVGLCRRQKSTRRVTLIACDGVSSSVL